MTQARPMLELFKALMLVGLTAAGGIIFVDVDAHTTRPTLDVGLAHRVRTTAGRRVRSRYPQALCFVSFDRF